MAEPVEYVARSESIREMNSEFFSKCFALRFCLARTFGADHGPERRHHPSWRARSRKCEQLIGPSSVLIQIITATKVVTACLAPSGCFSCNEQGRALC